MGMGSKCSMVFHSLRNFNSQIIKSVERRCQLTNSDGVIDFFPKIFAIVASHALMKLLGNCETPQQPLSLVTMLTYCT